MSKAKLYHKLKKYYEMKKEIEDLREELIGDLEKVGGSFEKDGVSGIVEVKERRNVDAEYFYRSLPNGKKKNFPKMVSINVSKAKKFVNDRFIDTCSEFTEYESLKVRVK